MTKLNSFLAVAILVLLLGVEFLRSGEKTQLDIYGDPLPPGATARFGSIRWRITSAIRAVAVSPNSKLIAAVNMDGKVAVWEKANGRLVHEIPGSVASVAFSPDGKYLATGGRPNYKTRAGDFHIRVWDLQTGKLKTVFPAVSGSPISKLLITADSATLISAGVGQPVTVWKFPSGEKIRTFPINDGPHHDVALSHDEKWLAVSGDDLHNVTVYSFDGNRIFCKVKAPFNYFLGFEFTPDNKTLMTHECDGLRFWDVATGKLRSTIALKIDQFSEAHLTPDGKKIALISYSDKDIHWLDSTTAKQLNPWKGSVESIWAFALSRDGKTVVSGDWGAVRVWDADSGKIVQQPQGPANICYAVRYSADSKTVVAASYHSLHFLDGQTLREKVSVPVAMDLNQYPEYRYSIAISPDGHVAAFLGEKDAIRLVDSRDPQRVRTLRREDWMAACLVFSPDGKRLYATGHKSPGLRVWKVETGEENAPLDDDVMPLSNLALARRAEKLAVVVKGAKSMCRFWDLRTGKEEPGFELTNGPVKYGPDNILLSDDGKWLLAYHWNSHFSVWDVDKKTERHQFQFGFEDGPFGWAFSADSKRLVTSHGDGNLRTWDMETGKKVAEVHGHAGHILDLVCSPDGAGVVSTCTSCTVLRWQQNAGNGK